MVTSVSYSPEHRQGILTLLDDVPYKHLIWHWQFEDAAVCNGFDPVVLEDDGRVVAFNGVMPAPAWYDGQWIEGLWSCDFYVASEYRGQGLGRQTKEALMEKAPLIMSFGVSQKAAAVLEHMGWRLSPEAQSYRLHRQVRSARDLALVLIQGFNRLLAVLSFRKGKNCGLYWRETLPEFGEIDELWARSVHGYRKIVRRDSAYLDWKYQRHPLAHYRFLIARTEQGELEAILVVREHNGSLRIVDWLGPARDRSLKYTMIRECCRHYAQCRHVSATTTDREFGEALCAAGFFRARTRPSFYVRSCIAGDEDFEFGWFIMTGDSDGELLMAARDNYSDGSKG